MPDQPLQPFAPPQALLGYLPEGFASSTLLLNWLFYLVFAFWAVYTIVAVYHWLKYSNAARIATPSIIVHLVVSIALILYIL